MDEGKIVYRTKCRVNNGDNEFGDNHGLRALLPCSRIECSHVLWHSASPSTLFHLLHYVRFEPLTEVKDQQSLQARPASVEGKV